jgi:hypothetical protein
MNYIKKITVSLLSATFLIGFAACSDDDNPAPVVNSPKLDVDASVLKVKIGVDEVLPIKQGGGEYNAFSLDTTIAQTYLKDDQIEVKGIANGQTTLIVSDKGGYYQKVPVSVYTTDQMQLSETESNIESILGRVGKDTVDIVLGNGGYSASSDDARVTATVNASDEIIISATSKSDAYTANVTVSDVTGLTATVAVTVKANKDAFTQAQLDDIMKSASRRYVFNDYTFSSSGKSVISEDENGVVKYGSEYYSSYYTHLTFTGGKSVGKKTDATFDWKYYYGGTYSAQPVDLEVIKNDGTNIWAIYSFAKDDYLYNGYFCDKVNP